MPLRPDYRLSEAEQERAADLWQDPTMLFEAISDALGSLDYHGPYKDHKGKQYPASRTGAALVEAFRIGNAQAVYAILEPLARAYLADKAVDEIQEEADDARADYGERANAA